MAENQAVRLVIYPWVNTQSEAIGETGPEPVFPGLLYVINGHKEILDIVAGPPPKETRSGDGGHTAESTQAGIYVLDKAEIHTTPNWPASVVPWGAEIRRQHGIIQYRFGNQWRDATGPRGGVTQALRLWNTRTEASRRIPPQRLEEIANSYFIDRVTGQLTEVYKNNDFGKVSWNLKRNGKRTAYYIHTTPFDEFNTAAGNIVTLTQSHGCIHIRPQDRDRFVKAGYLREGITVDIRQYGEVGPPADF